MYPSFEYDPINDSGLIKHADLPDVIKTPEVLTTTPIIPAQTWLKLNVPVFVGDISGGYALVYEAPPNTGGEDYIVWNNFASTNSGTTWNTFAGGGGIGECLIDETFWRDDFADTYTVTIFNIFINIGTVFATNTVTRVSLCEWRGESIDGEGNVVDWRLLYVDRTTNLDLIYRWAVTVGTFEGGSGGSKTGAGNFQNTPEGDYFYHQNNTLKLASVS
jgi:hypothetical protein